jgi:predicted small secreted protein
MARHAWAGAALIIAALMLSACATSVAGRAIRASGQPPGGSARPHAAVSAPVGDSYFTSARPPECSAALLFKGSPLLPSGSSDRAESAYRLRGPALYAESVDVYKALKPHDVVSKGFAAVAQCHGDAVGVAPLGEFRPMRLSFFGTTDDGVLVWTMTRPDWTCDYGLAVLPRVALMLSACDNKRGFPMMDWASKRRAQLDRRTA